MLTSNLWVDVGFHDGTKGKIVDFVYKHVDWPLTNNGKYFPEAVVVQFHSMEKWIEPFLEGVPTTVVIPVVLDGWIIGTKYFIRKQFPLVLLWAFTTHKSQGRTLYLAVIDIGNSERCYGMTLVALY